MLHTYKASFDEKTGLTGGARGWMRAITLKCLGRVIRDAGADSASLFDAHGISAAVVERPETVVPIDKMASLLEEVAETLGIVDVGMRIARLQRRERSADPIDLVIANAPSLRDACLFGERHISYFFSNAVSFGIIEPEDGSPVCLHYSIRHDRARSIQIAEYCALTAVLDILELADARPLEVWFGHDPAAPDRIYLDNFRTRARFAMPQNAVFVDALDWRRPIRRRDPRLYRQGKQLAARRRADTAPLSAHLWTEIERLLPIRKCSYDWVCEWSGIPPRTLRRYLADEQMTFTQLRDEVRRETVDRALSGAEMELRELARRAGYYEPRSLRRGMRRWFGLPAD